MKIWIKENHSSFPPTPLKPNSDYNSFEKDTSANDRFRNSITEKGAKGSYISSK